MGIMKRVRNTGINGTTSPSSPHFCFSCCTTRFEVVIVKRSETGGDAAFSGGEGERC
jgi:hypothetical protein